MKHLLLILISFILLSSPVIGQETGVLYLIEVNSEVKWVDNGDEDKDVKYLGEIINGKPNGKGTLTYPDGKKYLGEFKNGFQNGQGTLTYPNGDKYFGEWKDGKIHGQGTITFPDGRKYVGEWNDWKFNGQGIFTWSDGKKYVGEFKDEKRHGQGTMTYSGGDKYEGGFLNGKQHGQGTFTFISGGKFEGEFLNGKQHGQGTHTYPDGSNYVGEWREGFFWKGIEYDKKENITKKYVNGKRIRPDLSKFYDLMYFEEDYLPKPDRRGVLYIGIRSGETSWYEKKWEGLETEDNKDIGKYEGDIVDGFPYGYGTMTLPDESKYVGLFRIGNMDGQGTMTLSDGSKYVGEWRMGRPMNGTQYDKNGNIDYKIVNGKEE